MAYRGRQTAGPWASSVRCLAAIAAQVCVSDPPRPNPRKNPWQKIGTRISSCSERWRRSEKLRQRGRAVGGRKRRRTAPASRILPILQQEKNRNGFQAHSIELRRRLGLRPGFCFAASSVSRPGGMKAGVSAATAALVTRLACPALLTPGVVHLIPAAVGARRRQLARRSGLRQSHISRLERGRHSPSCVTLEKIAQALGIPVSQLDASAG
jgi:transcriptional regulator with XRE-family HTH domain